MDIYFFVEADKYTRSQKLKHNIIHAINELIAEIEFCNERIAEQAVDYIHHK